MILDRIRRSRARVPLWKGTRACQGSLLEGLPSPAETQLQPEELGWTGRKDSNLPGRRVGALGLWASALSSPLGVPSRHFAPARRLGATEENLLRGSRSLCAVSFPSPFGTTLEVRQQG